MTKEFEILNNAERALLLKAPVLVSILASCSYNEINKAQKGEAIKLSHLKTFTADPLLVPYYIEVEKNFREKFEETIKLFLPCDEVKRNMLKREIDRVNKLISGLDQEYAAALHKSLDGYAKHVKKAAHSIFQDFIFPMPIKGLTY